MIRYDDFVDKVCELGMLGNAKTVEGFPCLGDFTSDEQLWTNDPDLDPWLWKDRVTEEKKLVYGSYFMGKKGFLSPEFFGIFYEAFHPVKSLEERYESGKLGQWEWKLYGLLKSEGRPLGTHEIRAMLGVSPKNGASSVDTATMNLQLTFDIITSGNADMLDKNGLPYNKSVQYALLDDYAPPEWRAKSSGMGHERALKAIYTRAQAIGTGLTGEGIEKLFSKPLKLYRKYL